MQVHRKDDVIRLVVAHVCLADEGDQKTRNNIGAGVSQARGPTSRLFGVQIVQL